MADRLEELEEDDTELGVVKISEAYKIALIIQNFFKAYFSDFVAKS